MADRIPIRRCAIYARKSSEEGLDMSYNSLEAQRDACAAYITSQRHEGWVQIRKVYEDGGYSGGNMDRPGVKELLDDVGKGLIDIIVVYKIDRLTRSLTDFARLTELLDRQQVSFVAVTQQFNTSTSMGRLTLNVLLSFAQFEREVAGERIRDKVAASKKKGIWMGGPVPLGYAAKDRKLIVVPEEADIVRSMFTRYLELRSVHLLQRELEQQGVRSRIRSLKDGRTLGGTAFSRGAISLMLKSPIYLGLIRHGAETHPGQHEAIIDPKLFQRVQDTLAGQSPGDDARTKRPATAILKGIVFDAHGGRLQPTFSNKKGARYHYYTSAKRLRDAGDDPQGVRVPTGDLERLVGRAVADRLRDAQIMQRWLASQVPVGNLAHIIAAASDIAVSVDNSISADGTIFRALIEKVTVSKSTIEVRLSESALRQHLGISDKDKRTGSGSCLQVDDEHDSNASNHMAQARPSDFLDIVITSHLLRCGKQVKLVLGPNNDDRREPNPQLVEMVVLARRWFDGLRSGHYASLGKIAADTGLDRSYISRLVTLAFLAPDITGRIVTGDHSPTLTSERLRKACPLPFRWDEQRAMLLV